MNRRPAVLLLLLIVSLVGAPLLSVASIAPGNGAAQDHPLMMLASKSDMAKDCARHTETSNDEPVMDHNDCAKQCCNSCTPVFSLFTIPSISVVEHSCNAVVGQVAPYKGYEPDARDRPPLFTF
ncbi:MAG: hypothetical protein AMJ68_04115 [Acidithiobacillales bacterium SG8_45]|jgi:hypothetical protein|nr:MAG: hypothetical protein AMJ68_04115 [Acidithiobacillales bacterium SG8_45]